MSVDKISDKYLKTNASFAPICTIGCKVNEVIDELVGIEETLEIITNAPSVSTNNSFISVKDYGAIGNGIIDDTLAINTALVAAITLKKDLFFPTGDYLCNTVTSYIYSFSTNKQLRLESNNKIKMKIFGEKNSKITTTLTQYTLFYFYNNICDLVIENLFFENTHIITTNQTTGLSFAGSSLNKIKNLTIRNCRFEGFSTAILMQGVTGATIENNVFEAPLGHDNAQNSSQPAVYIWFADNNNGQCYDIKVLNNVANGYTGTDITTTTTLRPMDGFVFGIVYGFKYIGNTTKNFSEEHILLHPASTITSTAYTSLITNNQFYCSIPANSMKSEAPLIVNYAVRADGNNVNIVNNDFIDYTIGVLIYPFVYPTLKQHGYNVTNNRFYSPRSAVYDIHEAIKIQGSPDSGNEAYNVIVKDNYIDIDTISMKRNSRCISLYDCENSVVTNNNIFCNNVTLNGFTLYGILYSTLINNVSSGNNMVGVPSGDYE